MIWNDFTLATGAAPAHLPAQRSLGVVCARRGN